MEVETNYWILIVRLLTQNFLGAIWMNRRFPCYTAMIVTVVTIKTVNSPTVLQRILQIIKRRRINIRRFTAQEKDSDHGFVKVELDAEVEQVRLLMAQIEKQVDVIAVKSM